jgi:large subunit ribosomal protein L25
VICSPEDIPESIDVDISGLEINYSKHLSEVELPSSVRVVGKLDQTLVTIVPPSGYAEEMKAAAEAAAAASVAAAAAAAAPAEGAAPGAAPGAAAPAAGAAPAAEKK